MPLLEVITDLASYIKMYLYIYAARLADLRLK
jgi:hypothetical protein